MNLPSISHFVAARSARVLFLRDLAEGGGGVMRVFISTLSGAKTRIRTWFFSSCFLLGCGNLN